MILHLQTTDGDIDTTTTHPFYVVGEGWRAAGDLKVGDKIYALDGTTITITAVRLEKLNKTIKVYNLEVADFHTYFVGNTGMLVHNKGGCGDDGDGFESGGKPKPNDYYKEGLKDIPDNWFEVEAPETFKIKSDTFKEFLRGQGENPKSWYKVTEKWASPDGTIYQRNY